MKSLVVLFVAASFSVFAQQSADWKQDSIKYNHLINSDSIEFYLLQHFNTLRKSHNLKPLTLYANDSAYVKCNQWADYLLANKKIGHNGEAYEIAVSYLIIKNEYIKHSRDINKFLAYEFYEDWLNSPSHKLAILNPDKKFMIACTRSRLNYNAPFFNKNLIGLARFFE